MLNRALILFAFFVAARTELLMVWPANLFMHIRHSNTNWLKLMFGFEMFCIQTSRFYFGESLATWRRTVADVGTFNIDR